METDIRKVENRVRGTGSTVQAFLKSVDVSPSTWHSWKAKPDRIPLNRWAGILEAVEKREASDG